MGTRHLTCVVIDDQIKVAQYGQWDGYPTGQGEIIREFLSREGMDMPRFEKNVRACSWLTESDREEISKFSNNDGWMSSDQAAKFNASKWGYLSRNTGAGILDCILQEPRKLDDSSEFAADSLFCEWAYVIDLDKLELEIYMGFNTDGPVSRTERFAYLNDLPPPEYQKGEKKYWPVKLAKSIPIQDLPETDMGALANELEPEEEDV